MTVNLFDFTKNLSYINMNNILSREKFMLEMLYSFTNRRKKKNKGPNEYSLGRVFRIPQKL